MFKRLVLVAVSLGSVPILPFRAAAQSAPPAAMVAPGPPANPTDVKSADAIVAALYDVISGPAGQKRDWDRFRSLFAPGARLIPSRVTPDGKATLRVLSPDDYATATGTRLEQAGFFEREIGRTTETFGSIMHAFSAYESKHTAADEKPFARGINSIQLLNDGSRWWIVTVYWDSERDTNPLPAKYIGKHEM